MRSGYDAIRLARHAVSLVLALALLAFVAGCAAEEPAEPPEPVETVEPAETPEVVETPPPPLEPTQYELTFDATWSGDTHPIEFPSNPHFSGLIGAVHGPEAIIWSPGQLASAGMKNMAETGGKNATIVTRIPASAT